MSDAHADACVTCVTQAIAWEYNSIASNFFFPFFATPLLI